MSTRTGAYCPHCGVEYVAELCDQEGLVSYWGEGEPTSVYCLNPECEQDFEIREHVTRTWSAVVEITFSRGEMVEATSAIECGVVDVAEGERLRVVEQQDGGQVRVTTTQHRHRTYELLVAPGALRAVEASS